MFLPKPKQPDTLAVPLSRVQDLSNLPTMYSYDDSTDINAYAEDDNIDVPASKWIHTEDENKAQDDDVDFDDNNEYGTPTEEADKTEDSEEYEYYDDEGNLIPPDELESYVLDPTNEPVQTVKRSKTTDTGKYICPVCFKEYKQEKRLTSHIKQKHPEKA